MFGDQNRRDKNKWSAGQEKEQWAKSKKPIQNRTGLFAKSVGESTFAVKVERIQHLSELTVLYLVIVYKYLHPDRLDVLENSQIRFSPPEELNDPFEFFPNFSKYKKEKQDFVRKEFRKRTGKEITPEILIESLKPLHDKISEIQKTLGKSFIMLCLSKTNNNSLMWSHYADSHKGFVIGFDSESSFFKPNKGKSIHGLREVKYSEIREDVIIENSDEDSMINFEKIFFTKSVDWKYEEELRILAHPNYADKAIKVGVSDICLFGFPNNSIKEVILGCRMSKTNRDKIIEVVKKKYSTANLLKAKLSERSFNFDIEEL